MNPPKIWTFCVVLSDDLYTDNGDHRQISEDLFIAPAQKSKENEMHFEECDGEVFFDWLNFVFIAWSLFF